MSHDGSSRLSAEQDLVVIQRNPTSGSGRNARELQRMIRRLRACGLHVRLFADRDRLDSYLRELAAPERVRCLVAAGGDGTLASLAHRHPGYSLGLLPMGTENLVARYLRVGRCGERAAQVVVDGHTRVFDTGFVGDQRFLLMVSVGFDAEVVRVLSGHRTGNISHFSYLKPIIRSLKEFRFPEYSLMSADGTLIGRGTHIVVTNIPEYGFRMPFSPDASPHDGKLDIRIFQRRGAAATMWHALKTRLGSPGHPAEVLRTRLDSLSITCDDKAGPVQFDGDPCGSCPIDVRVDPASMTLVVPA